MSQLSFFPYGQKCAKCHFSDFVFFSKEIAKKKFCKYSQYYLQNILSILGTQISQIPLEMTDLLIYWLLTPPQSHTLLISHLKRYLRNSSAQNAQNFLKIMMRIFVEFFFCNIFGQNDKMWKMAFFTFLAIGEKRKLRHQIPPRYILGHHRQWKFLKKNKNFRTGIFRAASDLRNASEAEP